MLNLPNYTSSIRSVYPGEYTPNPTISEMFNEPGTLKVKSAFFSKIDISEDAEYYLVDLDAPGLRRKDFIVSINKRGNLSVTGIHRDHTSFQYEDDNKTEANYSEFSREFILPKNIDTDFIKAQYKSGVLSIWFLKTNKPDHKRSSLVIVY